MAPGNINGEFMLPSDLLKSCVNMLSISSQLEAQIMLSNDALSNCDSDLALEDKARIPICFLSDKQLDNAEDLSEKYARDGHRQVLAADYFPAKIATRFRGLGIQYMDAQGNAFISQSGYHIVVVGKRPSSHKTATTSLGISNSVTGKAFQPSGLKMVFALINNEGLAGASLREIADKSNVSLGSVSAIHKDLIAQGFLKQTSQGFEIRDKEKLINKWAETYPYKMRNKTHLGRFTANEVDWWMTLSEGQGFQLGGEIAAYYYSKYLSPKDGIAYTTQKKLPNLMKAARLRKIKEGEQPAFVIDVYEPFWGIDSSDLAAPPLVTYSDLLSTDEPRNDDAAGRIYDEFLD
jgi:hypothetical protein